MWIRRMDGSLLSSEGSFRMLSSPVERMKTKLGKQEWMDPYSVMRGVSACSYSPYSVLKKTFKRIGT